MKKSELSFKCVLADDATEIYLKQQLGLNHKRISGNRLARFYNGCLTTTSSTLYFCAWPEPIMNYQDALKLIANVEPDAPEFDIKPFDKVLVRTNENSEWSCDFHNLFDDEGFWVIGGFGNESAKMMIKYEGNEALVSTTDAPIGWWECENGKPVWRTK